MTRRTWVLPAVVFALLSVIFCATSTRGVASTDDHAPAVEAWRIASAGTFWLEDVLHGHGVQENTWIHEVPNGHVVADRMAGPVLISIPAYLLLDRDPARFTLVPGGLAAAVATALTCTLFLLSVRRRIGDRAATTATLVLALTTPTWSVSADGPWTHTVTQLGIAGAAYACSRDRWWMAGMMLGLGMTGRPHIALVAAVLGVGLSWTRRSWGPVLGVAVPTVATLGLLLVWNHAMFGTWTVTSSGYVGHGAAVVGDPLLPEMAGLRGKAVNVAGFLVAPDRGLVVWTPLLLAMLPAVRRSWRSLPDWARLLPVGGVAYTALQLAMNVFHGGDNFYGYRIGLELLTTLAPAFALSMPSLGPLGRRVAAVLAGLQFAAVSVGAVTPAIFVMQERVWVDNSFWMAVRALPVVMSGWVLVCVAAALVVLRRSEQRPASQVADVGEYRRVPEVAMSRAPEGHRTGHEENR